MRTANEKSNAQGWELEVTCKNKKYLDEVVKAILKYGMIEFEVSVVEFSHLHGGGYDGRYLVFMWCSWFSNLNNIATDLAEIEERFLKEEGWD